MSRLTGSDVKSMMEAYNAVYAPQELTEEQVWEEVENWVNSLLEEGYDLSEYTWEEMYESYIEEVWGTKPGSYKPNRLDKAMSNVPKAFGFGSSPDRTGQVYAGPGVGWVGKSKPSTPEKPAATTPARPAATTPARPAAPRPAAKPPAASKPAPSGQTGDKTKDMDTWAKANPKLAAAAAEKARIRGTQQTDNPLMKSMRPRLPMNSPSVQSPEVSKLGAGNQSLVNNPNALKAAKPQTVKSSYEYDAYDLVLEYLLAEGHADTLEEANYVMLEMDAEMVQDIVETCLDEANKAEKMLGLTSRGRERARNLNQYTDRPIFYGTNPNRRKKPDNSDRILNKAHKKMTKTRQDLHKSGRNTRGDTGESGGKSRYQANTDHNDGYPSITKRGRGPV